MILILNIKKLNNSKALEQKIMAMDRLLVSARVGRYF
jgi:hypothetical protein